MVVDACVWIAALLPQDPHHDEAVRFLRHQACIGGRIALPTLALAEICGAVARRTGNEEVARAVFDFLRAQQWLILVSLDERLGKVAAGLALRHRLRGADAVYVAVAQDQRMPLVTLDVELRDRVPDSVHCLKPGEELQ